MLTPGIESFYKLESDRLNKELNKLTQFQEAFEGVDLYVNPQPIRVFLGNYSKHCLVFLEGDSNGYNQKQKDIYKSLENTNLLQGVENIDDFAKAMQHINKTYYDIHTLESNLFIDSIYISKTGGVYVTMFSEENNWFVLSTENINLGFTDFKSIVSTTNMDYTPIMEYINQYDNISLEALQLQSAYENKFTDFLKKLWENFVKFIQKVANWLKDKASKFLSWVKQLFAKKKMSEEELKELHEVIRNASPKQREAWLTPIVKDFTLSLDKIKIKALSIKDLTEVCTYGKNLGKGLHDFLDKIGDESNTHTQIKQDMTNSKDLNKYLESQGIPVTYTGQSTVLKGILNNGDKNIPESSLIDFLKENNIWQDVSGENIIDLYKKTESFLTNACEVYIKSATELSKDIQSITNGISTKTFEKLNQMAADGIVKAPNMFGESPDAKFIQFTFQHGNNLINQILNLINISGQNLVFISNKLLDMFKYQFHKVLEGNTHSKIAFNLENVMECLKSIKPIATVEGVHVYHTSEFIKALSGSNSIDDKISASTYASLSNGPGAWSIPISNQVEPIILINEDLNKEMNTDALKCIMYHEYGHCKNNDFIVTLSGMSKLSSQPKKCMLLLQKDLAGLMRNFRNEHAADMVSVEYNGAEATINALSNLIKVLKDADLSPVIEKVATTEIYKRIKAIKKEM